MANQRLEQLMKKTDVQYAGGGPLLLEACALYLDRKTDRCIAQLKWKNIDARPVQAVMIELDGYDAFQQKLEPVSFVYDGLLVPQGDEFGGTTPVILKHNKALNYDVRVKAVSFADASVWRAAAPEPFSALPENRPQPLSGALLEQLQRDLSEAGSGGAALYMPQTHSGLWQCGCGSWQYAGTPCIQCGITWEALAEASEASVLEHHLRAYEEELERLRVEAEQRAEEARIARERAAKEQREREEAERRRLDEERRRQAKEAARRRARARKRAVLCMALAVVMLVGGYFAWTTIQKTDRYHQAVALMQTGSYEDARAALHELGDYKDCLTLLKQVDANELWDNHQYAAAYDIYATLPVAYQIHARDYEYNYQTADKAEKSGDYATAASLFSQLGNFKDAAARYAAAEKSRKEALAESHMAAGEYDLAREVYLDLGYADEASECLYLTADQAEQSGDYATAASLFSQLGSFKDAAARYAAAEKSRKEALAESYMAAGSYDLAREVYLDLGYADEAAECLYILSDAQAAEQPWLAYEGFVSLGDYKDSAQRASDLYGRRFAFIGDADANQLRVFQDPDTSNYGLLDSQADVAVQPEYTSVVCNANQTYTVEKAGLYGVIDASGKTVLPIEYHAITAQDGLYWGEKDSMTGLFKSDGTTLIPVEYQQITAAASGYQVVKDGKSGWSTSDGQTLIPPLYDSIEAMDDGRFLVKAENAYGVLDENGVAILEPRYDSIAYENTNTYTVVQDGKYGIIAYDGTIAHEATMELVQSGSNDGKYLMFRENGFYGFMDAGTFAVLVAPEWKEATKMTDGYAYIRNNLNKWGVIDCEGNIVVSPQWDSIDYYEDCGYALCSGKLMNPRGKMVCDFEYSGEYLGNGVFRNKSGTKLYSAATKTAYAYTINSADLCKMRMLTTDLLSGHFRSNSSSWDWQYGVISISKKQVLTNQPWENEIVSLPSINTVNGKYGWIGADGTDLVDPDYDYMMPQLMHGYIAAGKYNDRGYLVYSLIDPSNGNVVADQLGSMTEAFNYFGKPVEGMTTHDQLLWILTNAGFDTETASDFIQHCLDGAADLAENDHESIEASPAFRGVWSSLNADVFWGKVDTEEKLLDKFIELGLFPE